MQDVGMKKQTVENVKQAQLAAAGKAESGKPEASIKVEGEASKSGGEASKVKGEQTPKEKLAAAKKRLEKAQKGRAETGNKISMMGQGFMQLLPAAAEFMTKDDQALAQRMNGFTSVLQLAMNLSMKSVENAAQGFSTESGAIRQVLQQAARGPIIA
jgi:hypothetical protein